MRVGDLQAVRAAQATGLDVKRKTDTDDGAVLLGQGDTSKTHKQGKKQAAGATVQ